MCYSRRVSACGITLALHLPLLGLNLHLRCQAQTDYPLSTLALHRRRSNPPRRPPNPRAFANHHIPACQTNNTCFLLHTLRLTTPPPSIPSQRGVSTSNNKHSSHHTTSHCITTQTWQTWTSTSRAATRSRACSPTASGTSWTSSSTQSTTHRGKQPSPCSPPCCYLHSSAR